jgi:Fe(3+) dicitrate transport protein
VSLNYELGARWESRVVSGELIGFYNDYSNLVGTCTQSAGCEVADLDEQFNAGRAGVIGAELVLNSSLKLPAAILAHAQLTYTWTRARFLESFSSGFAQWGDDVQDGDELPYLPAHQASLKLSLERGSFGLGGVYTYVSEMRDSAGSGAIDPAELIPAQSLLDLNAHYRASEAGRLYLTLDNALDQRFIASRRPFGARPTKPRLLKLGYQHRF